MVQLTVTQSDTVHADEAHDRTQGTEAPDSTLDATAKLPSAADRRSPRAVHTRGLRRCPAAFGGRGGEGRKRREARGRSLYLNHKCLPPSHRASELNAEVCFRRTTAQREHSWETKWMLHNVFKLTPTMKQNPTV